MPIPGEQKQPFHGEERAALTRAVSFGQAAISKEDLQ